MQKRLTDTSKYHSDWSLHLIIEFWFTKIKLE